MQTERWTGSCRADLGGHQGGPRGELIRPQRGWTTSSMESEVNLRRLMVSMSERPILKVEKGGEKGAGGMSCRCWSLTEGTWELTDRPADRRARIQSNQPVPAL